jgi:hypothetical protein
LALLLAALRGLLRGRRRSSLPEKRFAEDLIRYMEMEGRVRYKTSHVMCMIDPSFAPFRRFRPPPGSVPPRQDPLGALPRRGDRHGVHGARGRLHGRGRAGGRRLRAGARGPAHLAGPHRIGRRPQTR